MTVLLLMALSAAEPSRYTSVDVNIEWEPGEKVTIVEYSAVAGDDGRFLRVSRDFDPASMSVELLETSYGFPGHLRESPEWAVDTLTGSEGWPRALVVAFPGLRPGMGVSWSFRIIDTGSMSRQGLFYAYLADDEPDTIRVECTCPIELNSYAEGFTSLRDGDRWTFESEGEEYRELWLSTASQWSEIENVLTGSSRLSASETPPDLREAAIEAGAAGALPRMRISRGRVLITESLQMLPFPGGDAGFISRPLQEILDTRRATPLEAAVLLSAMCRVMGIDAPVIPATDIQPPIPSPLGFNRVFILADGILEEPSEYLSPAGWVDTEDTLWLLLPGGVLAEYPPSPETDVCLETWNIDPASGSFLLRIETGGGFDRELRRRLAGLDGVEAALCVSEWFRASGVFFYPESVSTSDLFDLTEPAAVEITGSFPPASGTWVDNEPVLKWNRSGAPLRTYPDCIRSGGLVIIR